MLILSDAGSVALNEPRRWLLVPVQVKVRELVAKVLLAGVAVERGYGVVLGTHMRLRPSLGRFPPSVVLDYSLNLPFLALWRTYHRTGHRVAACEEEGLIQIPTDAFPEADLFLAWGSEEASRLLMAHPDGGSRVRLTGNARFDLLRPEFRQLHARRVEGIRARFGRYVLINTNFPANVQFGVEALQQINRFDRSDFDDSLYQWYVGRDAHSARIFRAFKELVPALAESLPTHTVVVRPHPSEDDDAWHAAVGSIRNVRIERSGSVVPWILGSDAIIHNSCTTGIEARALGAYVVSYRPVQSKDFDWSLANDVSEQVYSLPELLEVVVRRAAQLDRGSVSPPTSGDGVLRKHIEGLEGRLASERIIDAIDEIAQRPASLSWHRGSTVGPHLDHLLLVAKHQAKRALGRTKIPLSFERQKNPGWELDEINDLLVTMRRCTGRFGHVEATTLYPGVTALFARQ